MQVWIVDIEKSKNKNSCNYEWLSTLVISLPALINEKV